jgi:hypothetical protein
LGGAKRGWLSCGAGLKKLLTGTYRALGQGGLYPEVHFDKPFD